ncbi:Tad domain-containing protein [Iodidimonas gelatinilytica]|uniref:Tad domain-containing protein n=1 Tax=Iodidimonas gelatinilytica TaxID=1236966 RepID=UPI003530D5DD
MLTWVAVSLIPLVVSVGGATDIARGFVLRSQLSTALDAAAWQAGGPLICRHVMRMFRPISMPICRKD